MAYEYDLICRYCGYIIERPTHDDYRIVDEQERFPYCPRCDRIMSHKVTGISSSGDYHHTSDSLAIHPDDIPKHRKLYPGIEVTSEGQPQFTSPKQQEKYALKSAGCYKKRQRIKSQRKRIA